VIENAKSFRFHCVSVSISFRRDKSPGQEKQKAESRKLVFLRVSFRGNRRRMTCVLMLNPSSPANAGIRLHSVTTRQRKKNGKKYLLHTTSFILFYAKGEAEGFALRLRTLLKGYFSSNIFFMMVALLVTTL
jgi:hypothetical protein